MLIQAPKGTKDILPEEIFKWHYIELHMKQAAKLAGYKEIRTPIFEHTELFLRGVGDSTDIVQKEMYTFLDKANRSISLKPEGTAGVVRALIQNSLYAGALPIKAYYINSPNFRYEAPQAGRYRQHHQFGMECFGSQSPSVDAELILSVFQLVKTLGIKNSEVHINSIGCPNCRPKYMEALQKFISDRKDNLCRDCQNRYEKNPMRILDCKQRNCQAQMKEAPVIMNYLCDECIDHFNKLKKLLDSSDVQYSINTHLVRGLDYYTKTVFEILTKTKKGLVAICGGGRYDSLIKQLGGPQLPAAGFGLGMERLLILLEEENLLPTKINTVDIFVSNIGDEGRLSAFKLTNVLRQEGISCECDHMGRSLKAQFKYANKLGAKIVIILGEEELKNMQAKIRDMKKKTETTIPIEQVVSNIKKMMEVKSYA